jgi:hypothetical protein
LSRETLMRQKNFPKWAMRDAEKTKWLGMIEA